MTETISTITSKILNYLGMGQEQSQTLRDKTMSVADREKIQVKEGAFPILSREWGVLVYDFNRIHFFKKNAKEMGFETTPIHGTLIAARVEQYVLGLLNEINNMNNGEKMNLVYAGQRVDFKRPLYPGNKAHWNLVDVVENQGGIDLKIFAINPQGKVVVSCPKSELRPEKAGLEIDLTHLSTNSALIKKKIEISGEELESFYKCLGKKPQNQIPFMYPAAFIPATLLEFSSQRTGKPEGGYSAMDLKFHNQPNLGIFEIILKIARSSKRKEVFFYNLEALCTQEDKPILSGKVQCYSPSEFKF